jgi:hypothetical protein
MACHVDTITITFGDRAENHVGMQQLGLAAAEGFSYEDLAQAKWRSGARALSLTSSRRPGSRRLGVAGGHRLRTC